MTKLVSTLLLSCLILASACSNLKNDVKEKAAPPNIVFIFADDMTYSAVHSLGNNEVKTPNIDRLVNAGTSFTHAYNMGSWSGAVCLASRAMFMSGRTVWNANEFTKKWSEGQEIDKTWGKLMESGGYDTYMTGKWHISAPAPKVFKTTAHIRPGMPNDAWDHFKMVELFEKTDLTKVNLIDLMPVGYHRPMSPQDSSWSPTDPKFGGFWDGGKHWSEVLKDDALTFIDSAKAKDNPFFMYLAFNAPHDPRQAPQEFVDMYPIQNISLPKSWLPMYPFKDGIANGVDLRDEALAPFPRTEYATKTHIQEYYASISHMDAQIGSILDALEASGKMENTYIVFTADHGLAMGRHGLLGKQTLFDHSLRAPFILVGPDVPKGERISKDIYIQDAMATSLELAGVPKPEYVEFNSVLPLLDDQVSSSYPSIYGGYLDVQRAIRKDGYKLLVYPKLNKTLLFDLVNDPEEMNDLAQQPGHGERVKNMMEDLKALQAQLKDPLKL